jgi:phosphoenolpyruvate phosphomutase
MRKTTRLRELVTRPELAFLMEAHSGLSARIVEEAGFEGVWGSGLTISAGFGVRDNNELSWSQVVDHVAFMTEATSVPLLLDGDTGYGNFNNMRRLVRKLEQVGVAGVTIEDKLFPKTNSFLRSERQPLADVDEFCGKIKAGKDSQSDPDFVLVARVEALIAGWGHAEAIKRAEAYHRAGADAILIHSKESSPAEIFAFLDAWGDRAPVVLVPTKYWRTPTEEFRARHVSVVIWANHVLRASISAMQATAARLRADEALLNVEPVVAPLHEVFRLQGDEELQQAEGRYLPAVRGGGLSAVVLAAGAGADFGGLTASTPKAMLKVQGRPILARLLDDFAHFGCRGVTVVRGHHATAVEVPGARFVDNTDFAATGEAWSLALAETELVPGTLVAFGDIVLKRHIIQALLEEAGDGVTLVVDSGLAGAPVPDRVRADRADTGRFSFDETRLAAIGDVEPATSHGAWIGLLHLGRDGATALAEAIAASRAEGTLRTARLSDLITRMVAAGRGVRVVYTRGGWVNVNNLADLLDASSL